MEIHINARWKGQTTAEKQAQESVLFNPRAGHLGYLCDGGILPPFATDFLAGEAIGKSRGTPIPASMLRRRLPETLRIAEAQLRENCQHLSSEDIQAELKSYTDFVDLCERKEKQTVRTVNILAAVD